MDKVIVKWMSYAVLCSSLDLDVFAPEISRVSNAYIESTNKVLKRHTFHGTTQSSIADCVRALKIEHNTTLAAITLFECKSNRYNKFKTRE